MQQLFSLDKNGLTFPDICDALNEPNGLLAVGGDLSRARLIAAYRQGIFPWYDVDQPLSGGLLTQGVSLTPQPSKPVEH